MPYGITIMSLHIIIWANVDPDVCQQNELITLVTMNISFYKLCAIKWLCLDVSYFSIEQSHKSHNALVPFPTVHHAKQKCVHFCSEWCIVGYGTGALWDFWIRSFHVTANVTIRWISMRFDAQAPILAGLHVPLPLVHASIFIVPFSDKLDRQL